MRQKFFFSDFSLNIVFFWKRYSLMVKGKAVPLQAQSGPEVSRKLRLQDYMTTM